MATAQIREYAAIGGNGLVQIAQEPGVTDQAQLTFTTSTASAAFNDATKFVAITASADYHYAVGANPTASATTSLKIPYANGPYFIGVKPGDKVALVAAA